MGIALVKMIKEVKIPRGDIKLLVATDVTIHLVITNKCSHFTTDNKSKGDRAFSEVE